jgi:transmembrane sensor
MADARDNPPSPDLPAGTDRPDDATLLRYLSGACGAADLARVDRWVAADPAHQSELTRLRAAWRPPPPGEVDPDDGMWRWLSARMDAPLPRPRLVRAYPAPARRWSLIAAAVVLALGGGLWVQLRRASHPTTKVTPAVAMRELSTRLGERATGRLPDGSRVILGPDTRLRVPVTFAGTGSAPGARDVYLEGEAFFDVAHDSTRPFRVHTANGIAEDLGTQFVVTAYPEARTTQVVVASGLVALRNSAPTESTNAGPVLLTLGRGDLGRVDAAGAALTRHVDVSAYVGWTDGRLVFDGTPLRDALTRLAHWYDLDIRLADTTLAAKRLTATFREGPADGVLRVLEIALDVRAEQSGRVVTLRPNR